MLSVAGSLMARYRDLVVRISANHRQLLDTTVTLARANTAYQEYAFEVRESATESERQRITRDIHDIVGYTLTNNMMLMEAAQDLMKENPLAIPTIIETARSNAEEGLNQVRTAMYELREQPSQVPVGINAVTRLTRIFQQATGIEIACDFSNMPASVGREADSAIYHLIQEALVNSFRHGRARSVRISFWIDAERLEVRVADDGVGTFKVVEGIGLRGMRERLEELGGSIRAVSGGSGFTVVATIPRGALR
jgi:signal transduction histidine kinase